MEDDECEPIVLQNQVSVSQIQSYYPNPEPQNLFLPNSVNMTTNPFLS